MELDKLLEEIARLKAGNELLDKVWTELGPYDDGSKLSDRTRMELQRFFNFDDSE
jgi:hypothetical protein